MSKEGDEAEEAPFSAEQELRLLVETIPALVWRAGPEGNVEYVNKRVLDYFGAPLDEIVGWGWAGRVHPEDVAFTARSWLKNLEAENPHDVVCRFRGADNRYRWFNVRGEPLRDSDGTVLRWYGVLIDIDDRTMAEEALRESEYKLRQIFETVPGLLWSTDPAGELTQLNQRLLDYSGMRLEDFKYGGWEAFLHPDDFPETAKAFHQAIQTGTSYEAVHRLRRADGEFRWHHARGEPLGDPQGRIIQWYGVSVDIDEAKRAEDLLRRSEAHLVAAQRLNHIGSSAGTDRTILYWSEETYRIWGFDPALGLPSLEAVFQRIHPDDRDWVRATAERAFSEKTGYSIAYRILLPDGTIKHIESIREPVFSPSGEFVEVVATQIDVTERKRAEEALRESEYKLRQVIETVPGLIWSNGPDGEPTHVSQRMLDYSGMRFEEFKHRGWEAFVHPDDFPETARAFYHAIQTGTSYQGVMRLRTMDGEFRWHHARCEPLRDRQGCITQWYGLSVDIDEAKKAEDRLRRSEAHLAEAQRLSRTGASITNESTILYFSEEAYRIWGFDPAQGVPSREAVFQRVHPDDRDRVRARAERVFREKTGYSHGYRIVLPDGTVKHIESIMEPVFSPSGELVEVVGTQADVTERKRAEEALRESEYKLRQIFETVPSLLWSTDPSGELTQINQRLWDYSGMRLEDFKHGGWKAFIHPDDFAETARTFQHAIQTGTSYDAVHRLRRADGEFRWYHVRGEPLRDPQGRIVQWYGVSVDIDEGKRAEDLLRRSEAYLAEAQSLSHTGSAAFNDTTILYWSDETYRIFGFDPRNGLPSPEAVQQVIHPVDLERAREEARRAVRQKRDYRLEYRILLPGGIIKYIEVVSHPKFSASGELAEVVSTLLDVTEHKRAEQGLRESETKFRDYAESASDWFWEIGPDYKFTVLTENAFGSDSDVRIGTACWDFALDLETEPERWRLLQETFDARKPFRDFVYCSVRRDGSPMYVKASGKPVFDADGEFRGYRGTGTDVTALMLAQEEHERLRQLESDLAHMNRLTMMGELTASLAHEIAQPIASARNNARAALNFLDKQPPDPDEVREALHSIVDDADRAGDIIERIRDHIKKAPPRKSRFDLNKAIDEVIGLAQSAITENGVSVKTRLAEALFPVEGDRVQLQQVVLNLILNAVEAMSTVAAGPRELSISTEQTGTGDVLVSVRDSGPGIDPDQFDRVFQAFYTTKPSGVGMGLSICRSIIDAHGGRLWADMNASGGAVFRFSLPGAGQDLTNSRRSVQRIGEPHEDSVSDAAHQMASEDNQPLPRSQRGRGQLRQGRQ